MTTDEKLARINEKKKQLTKQKKAEREKARRQHGKDNEKAVINLLKEMGYNPLKESSHENVMKYLNKYRNKIETYIKTEQIKKKDAESEEN